MTTQEIIDYYANLLVIQYAKRPKAYATIQAVVTPIVMDQILLQIQDAYSIETAVGVQLDVLGKYVGAARRGYNLSGQPVTLDDDDYRTLIKMLIIKNNSGSSLYTIRTLLNSVFPGMIRVSDNQLMQLNYFIVETLGSNDLLEVLVTGNYLPAPMAVQVSVTIVSPFTDPFFGFTSYGGSLGEVSPFNSYTFYSTEAPWFSYKTT